MYKKIGVIGIFLIVSLLVFFSQISPSSAQKEMAEAPDDMIKRGEYLVNFGGCNDCHTPKIFSQHGMEFDQTRLLSGHPANESLPEIDPDMLGPGKWLLFNGHITAAVGPWGISFAANLTPDEQTGIGLWTPEMFIKAMRTGKHLGEGRPILPPMPVQGLAGLTDDDLKAVFAYLKSITPIKNQVPAPIAPNEVTGKEMN